MRNAEFGMRNEAEEPRAESRETGRAEARLIVAASEADANLFYATRFLAPDPFVFLWHGDEKILLMSDLELDRARAQAAVDTVLAIRQYEDRAKASGIERPSPVDALWEFLQERRIRSLLVPGSFPIEHADRLRQKGITLLVGPEPFFEGRLVKSPAEVQAIASALLRTEAVMDAAIGAIREADVRDGVLWWRNEVLTSEALKRLIARQLLDAGLIAQHTIVACGEDACDPHNEGAGPLLSGCSIVIDIFPRDLDSRYFADITRTVVKGRAPDPLRRMYDAVGAGQGRAFDLIRDGADGEAIHREVLETMAGHGFQTGEVSGRMQGFFHGTGHGLGLEIHELPRVSKVKTTLRAGNVVTVEPGLYYRGVGGVRIEDVVVVTETGCQNLTKYPKEMEV
jgi:Xaa-Pro aminopeptidase